MEADGMVKIFKRSEKERDVRYTQYIRKHIGSNTYLSKPYEKIKQDGNQNHTRKILWLNQNVLVMLKKEWGRRYENKKKNIARKNCPMVKTYRVKGD